MNPPSLGSLYTLTQITGGTLRAGAGPEPVVTGLCALFPTLAAGDLLVHRGARPHGFLSNTALELAVSRGGVAIMTDAPDSLPPFASKHAVLQVSDVRKAIVAIGRHARQQFQGKVIGVTGTAGKTSTVQLITKILSSFGDSSGTTHSSNGPVGIAWTLCRPQASADFCTLEISMQQMLKNSALALPHIAVITNVGAAHLQSFHDVISVAKQKALIFSSMAPGGVAVINADMDHMSVFVEAAQSRSLKIVLYGENPGADVRLIHYQDGNAKIESDGKAWHYKLSARGRHFATNTLAAIGVLKALNLPLDLAKAAIEQFTPADGRGEELKIPFMHGHLTLRNDAYNANPLSMEASLATVAQVNVHARSKVVVLSDMLELGPDSPAMHEQLLSTLQQLEVDRLLLCGPLMHSLWLKASMNWPPRVREFHWVKDIEEAKTTLGHWLRPDDYLMIKGSHGTQLHTLVPWLKQYRQSIEKSALTN